MLCKRPLTVWPHVTASGKAAPRTWAGLPVRWLRLPSDLRHGCHLCSVSLCNTPPPTWPRRSFTTLSYTLWPGQKVISAPGWSCAWIQAIKAKAKKTPPLGAEAKSLITSDQWTHGLKSHQSSSKSHVLSSFLTASGESDELCASEKPPCLIHFFFSF